MKHIISFAFALSCVPALADPPPPPELTKTVDAFVGDWQLEGTQVIPGAPPEKSRFSLSCKKTALGRAVMCVGTDTTSAVPWEGAMLIGYNVDDGRVHYYSITTDPTVHDHACDWKKSELVCETLKATSHGNPMTEDMSWGFDKGRIALNVVIAPQGGPRITFNASGKRK